MPSSSIVKVKRDGMIVLADQGDTNYLEVACEPGDFSFSIPQAGVNNFLDRGRIGSTPKLRFGDDQPITGSFTVHMRALKDTTAPIVEELLYLHEDTGTGYINANWTPTLGTNSEVFTLNLWFRVEGSDHGDSLDHIIKFPHCHIIGDLSEGDPNTVTFNWTCYQVEPVSQPAWPVGFPA